jgi:hypothetical protein
MGAEPVLICMIHKHLSPKNPPHIREAGFSRNSRLGSMSLFLLLCL